VRENVQSEGSCIREFHSGIVVLKINTTDDLPAAIAVASLTILDEMLGAQTKFILDLCNVRCDDQVSVDALRVIYDTVEGAGATLRFANTPLEFAQALRAKLRYDFSIFGNVEETVRTF